jgi:hypothetical protein
MAGVGDKVTFRNEDLFDTDIRKASVLTLYLSLSVNIKLRPRILETLKRGARVLSHDFNMGDWLPDWTERVDGLAMSALPPEADILRDGIYVR